MYISAKEGNSLDTSSHNSSYRLSDTYLRAGNKATASCKALKYGSKNTYHLVITLKANCIQLGCASHLGYMESEMFLLSQIEITWRRK